VLIYESLSSCLCPKYGSGSLGLSKCRHNPSNIGYHRTLPPSILGLVRSATPQLSRDALSSNISTKLDVHPGLLGQPVARALIRYHTYSCPTQGYASPPPTPPRTESISKLTPSSSRKEASRDPKHGFLAMLPSAVVPYTELLRLEKPTGLYLFYFPYLFGLLSAASTAQPPISRLTLLATSTILFVGTFIMHGAGCTWNVIHDRAYDRLVARTCVRPLARGVVSPLHADAFTAAQSVVGLSILATLPIRAVYYSPPIIMFLGSYTFAKRVTNYPQVILGFPVALGILMGITGSTVDPIGVWLSQGRNSGLCGALGCFYVANLLWTIIHDTIYAHQDVVDDAKAGVKSIAVKHQKDTKVLISTLAVMQVSLLLATGILGDLGPLYYSGILGAGLSLATMIWRVDLKQPSECMWWFKNGAWFVRASITPGLLGQYTSTALDYDEDREDDTVVHTKHTQ